MKKKIFGIILCLAMLVSLVTVLTVPSAASSDLPEGAEWVVNEGEDKVWGLVNGSEVTFGGKGTVDTFDGFEGWSDLKDTLATITVSSADVFFNGEVFGGVGAECPVILTLADGWQGDLPDDDGFWYGAQVELIAMPLSARDISFTTRYPWQFVSDISFTLTGEYESTQTVTVSVYDGTTLLKSFTEDVDIDMSGIAAHALTWEMDDDLAENTLYDEISVVVTFDGTSVSATAAGDAIDTRTLISLPEGETNVTGVRYSATAWGAASSSRSTDIGWKNMDTESTGALVEGCTGDGIINVSLPTKDGTYALTHSAGALESYVKFVVSGYPSHTVTYTGDYTDSATVAYGDDAILPICPNSGYVYVFTVDGVAWNGTAIIADVTVTVTETLVRIPVAKVDETEFFDIESAILAVGENGTIELLADVSETTVTVSRAVSFKIKENGKSNGITVAAGEGYSVRKSGEGTVYYTIRLQEVTLGDTTYDTVGEAIEVVNNAAIISLRSDVFGTVTVSREVHFQIDAKGHKNELEIVAGKGYKITVTTDGDITRYNVEKATNVGLIVGIIAAVVVIGVVVVVIILKKKKNTKPAQKAE